MRWTLGEGERISDKLIAGVLVLALALGLVLYGVLVPESSGQEAAPAPLGSTSPAGETSSPATSSGSSSAPSSVATGGSAFGSGSAALDSGVTAGELVGSGSGSTPVPGTPSTPTPTVPAPACPTDAGSDIYESVIDPLSDALGEELPRDHVRLLAQIAAGCTSESPTTPLLGLALDIGRLVPDTGLPNVDLSAIPAVPSPAIPEAVIDALAPLQPSIMEACGTVGLLGVLIAVLPGTAGIPVNGSDLVDLVVPATSLCAQFEG